MGHGDTQHHPSQQGAAAAGELEHLGGVEDAALGIEGVVVADLDHGGPGGHGSGKQLGIHSADANRQPTGPGRQLHQGRITGHIHQIGPPLASGATDPLHRGRIEVGESGDHLQQAPLRQGGLQGNGQLFEARHRRHGPLALKWWGDSPIRSPYDAASRPPQPALEPRPPAAAPAPAAPPRPAAGGGAPAAGGVRRPGLDGPAGPAARPAPAAPLDAAALARRPRLAGRIGPPGRGTRGLVPAAGPQPGG